MKGNALYQGVAIADERLHPEGSGCYGHNRGNALLLSLLRRWCRGWVEIGDYRGVSSWNTPG